MLRRWSYVITDANLRRQDSVELVWENSNMTSERNLYTGETIASYTYYTDGKGRNPDNTPNQASRWLYRRGSNVVLSKDYAKTYYNTKYSPDYDPQGRLSRLTVEYQGASPANTTYTYKCR